MEQDMQWDGDPAGFLDDRARHEAPREEPSGHDAWLDHGQPDADCGHPSGDSNRAADLGQGKNRVQDRLPLGDGMLEQRKDEPVDDVLARPFPGLDRLTQIGAGLLDADARPVPATGQFDGHARESQPC